MKQTKKLSRMATVAIGLASSIFFIAAYYGLVSYQEVKRGETSAFGKIVQHGREVYLRPSNGIMWQGVLEPQKVFRQDTLKTGADSHLLIQTAKNDTISIAENSLVFLEEAKEGPSITLNSGRLSVQGKIEVKSSGQKILIEGTSSIKKSRENDSLEISAEKGTLSLKGADGQEKELSEGAVLTIESTGERKIEQYEYAPQKPLMLEEVLLEQNNKTINFEVKRLSGTNEDRHKKVIQISQTEDFKKPHNLPLANSFKQEWQPSRLAGKLFWRVFDLTDQQPLSRSAEFNVINTLDWAWETPARYRYATLEEEGLKTDLRWAILEGSNEYQVRVQENGRTVFETKQANAFLSWNQERNDLERVLRVGNADFSNKQFTFTVDAVKNGKVIATLMSDFHIYNESAPSAPTITKSAFVAEDSMVYAFEWIEVQGATAYEIDFNDEIYSTSKLSYELEFSKKSSSQVKLRSLRGDKKSKWTNLPLESKQIKRQVASIENIPKLLSPKANDILQLAEGDKVLHFNWSSVEGSQGYVLIIQNLEKQERRLEFRSRKLKIETKRLEPGRWAARVISRSGDNKETQSKTIEFKIKERVKE